MDERRNKTRNTCYPDVEDVPVTARGRLALEQPERREDQQEAEHNQRHTDRLTAQPGEDPLPPAGGLLIGRGTALAAVRQDDEQDHRGTEEDKAVKD